MMMAIEPSTDPFEWCEIMEPMGKLKRSILISLILAAFLFSGAQAHPADMYFHTHRVIIKPEVVQVIWELIPGPIITQSIWYGADQDDDQKISDTEAQKWAKSVMTTFSAEIDGEVLNLDLDGVEWPAGVQELYSGESPISITMVGQVPDQAAGIQHLSLHNRYNPKNSISWFEVLGEDGILFSTPNQNSGNLDLDFGLSSESSDLMDLTYWESGTPSIPWVIESVGLGDLAEEANLESQSAPAASSRPAAILEGLIQQRESSPTFILGALFLAALLGALHALSPGHGKTIVAAYLVGSRGKAYHAVALGGIVTLTHTGSVFLLGIITLTASRYLLAADLFPVLELVSGLLILFLGIGLLYPRLRIWFQGYKKQRKTAISRPSSVTEKGIGRLVIDQPIEEIGPPHSHEPGTLPRRPIEGDPLSSIRWRSLIPLAISGGLVPCPDAIAILLIAATINRIAFGLSLIVSFSLGLAVVLIVIGILIVQGKRLFERLRWFNQAAYIVPILSAVVVLGVGGVLSFNAVQNLRTASTQEFISGIGSEGDSFNIKPASIMYTALNEDNNSQLFIKPALGGEPQLIVENTNIWAYALAPDYSSAIYTTDDGKNGSQLWQYTFETHELEMVLECPNAYCADSTWSPDSRGVLYGRLDFDLDINPAGVQSIWWLDLETKETEPLFQDPMTPGFSPRWSSDGVRLSYSSINPLEIKIFNMETGESISLPTQLGYPGAWSPDGNSLLLVDIDEIEGSYLNKIFRYDLETDWLTTLGVEPDFDDAYPTWSPDGESIAFVRREWSEESSSAGNQLWIMGADGAEPRQLTYELEEVYFGEPLWSPDGHYLLYDYRTIGPEGVVTGIRIFDLDSAKETEIISPGSRPTWLP
jgi:ABC-type nickel/cobalt efflux system permease component RcnA/Tol biopolymer transport system component